LALGALPGGNAIGSRGEGEALSAGPSPRPTPTLGAGAAELRIRDTTGIYRAFYVVKVTDALLVFHAFVKKTQPGAELDVGRKRLKEMLP